MVVKCHAVVESAVNELLCAYCNESTLDMPQRAASCLALQSLLSGVSAIASDPAPIPLQNQFCAKSSENRCLHPTAVPL